MTVAIKEAEEAARLFSCGYACSQAVFSVFASSHGLDPEQALKIASMFGGGLSRRGQICGAASGGLMALGLACGCSDPSGKEAAYRIGAEFLHRFESRFGALNCRDLTGCDLSNPDERLAARQRGVFDDLCPRLVREAAGMAASLVVEMNGENPA